MTHICLQDKEKNVQYQSPLVWLSGFKPTEQETVVSHETLESKIDTAVIVKLYSKWGVLRSRDGDILFKVSHLFWKSSKLEVEIYTL